MTLGLQRSGRFAIGLTVGAFVGLTLSVLLGQSPVQTARAGNQEHTTGRYDIVDTPGSPFLLDRDSGQVWRLGFAEVKGDRYWFGTHVPLQEPTTFDAFQQSMKKRLGANGP